MRRERIKRSFFTGCEGKANAFIYIRPVSRMVNTNSVRRSQISIKLSVPPLASTSPCTARAQTTPPELDNRLLRVPSMFTYCNLAVVHGDDNVFLCNMETRTYYFHWIGNDIRGNRLRQDTGPDELRASLHDTIFRLE
jgi:hypothetical protein